MKDLNNLATLYHREVTTTFIKQLCLSFRRAQMKLVKADFGKIALCWILFRKEIRNKVLTFNRIFSLRIKPSEVLSGFYSM